MSLLSPERSRRSASSRGADGRTSILVLVYSTSSTAASSKMSEVTPIAYKLAPEDGFSFDETTIGDICTIMSDVLHMPENRLQVLSPAINAHLHGTPSKATPKPLAVLNASQNFCSKEQSLIACGFSTGVAAGPSSVATGETAPAAILHMTVTDELQSEEQEVLQGNGFIDVQLLCLPNRPTFRFQSHGKRVASPNSSTVPIPGEGGAKVAAEEPFRSILSRSGKQLENLVKKNLKSALERVVRDQQQQSMRDRSAKAGGGGTTGQSNDAKKEWKPPSSVGDLELALYHEGPGQPVPTRLEDHLLLRDSGVRFGSVIMVDLARHGHHHGVGAGFAAASPFKEGGQHRTPPAASGEGGGLVAGRGEVTFHGTDDTTSPQRQRLTHPPQVTVVIAAIAMGREFRFHDVSPTATVEQIRVTLESTESCPFSATHGRGVTAKELLSPIAARTSAANSRATSRMGSKTASVIDSGEAWPLYELYYDGRLLLGGDRVGDVLAAMCKKRKTASPYDRLDVRGFVDASVGTPVTPPPPAGEDFASDSTLSPSRGISLNDLSTSLARRQQRAAEGDALVPAASPTVEGAAAAPAASPLVLIELRFLSKELQEKAKAVEDEMTQAVAGSTAVAEVPSSDMPIALQYKTLTAMMRKTVDATAASREQTATYVKKSKEEHAEMSKWLKEFRDVTAKERWNGLCGLDAAVKLLPSSDDDTFWDVTPDGDGESDDKSTQKIDHDGGKVFMKLPKDASRIAVELSPNSAWEVSYGAVPRGGGQRGEHSIMYNSNGVPLYSCVTLSPVNASPEKPLVIDL